MTIQKQEITKLCTCHECVALCEANPGWMTPDEAMRAMDAGLASKLMLDFYVSDTQ